MSLLIHSKLVPLRYLVPLLQASAAASGGGMLGDEDRVIAHRGLLAVIRRTGGGKTLVDEFLCVRNHRFEPLALEIIPFVHPELEALSEG